MRKANPIPNRRIEAFGFHTWGVWDTQNKTQLLYLAFSSRENAVWCKLHCKMVFLSKLPPRVATGFCVPSFWTTTRDHQ